MKLWLCGLAAAATVAGAQAAEESGHYFKFDVGANYTGDLHQEFKNLPLERDLKMNLGVRGGMAEGFMLNRFLAVEVEASALWNELDNSNDWLLQVPVLANLVLRYECKGGWTAYVGIGGGGAAVIANTTAFAEQDSDMTFVPAWQGMAGLNYRFGGGLAIGVVYKYMGIADPKLEVDVFGMNQIFKLEDVQNHYGGVQLTYNF